MSNGTQVVPSDVLELNLNTDSTSAPIINAKAVGTMG